MTAENRPYDSLLTVGEEVTVPKRTANQHHEDFGTRLARLRHAAGYSQREFAAELGITQRMVAYYEGETEHPPTTLLPLIAKVLDVTTDELLGIKRIKNDQPPDGRLWRRFKQVEQLPPRDRREVIKVIDTFLEREQLKRKVAHSKSA